jgi:group I intron endonuclease
VLIYLVRHVASGKVYVGKYHGKSPKRRWQTHVAHARSFANGKKNHFHSAIRKYGPDAFVVSEIDRATTPEELCRLEQYYIAKFKSHIPTHGYNLTMGGDGGTKLTPEARQHLSEALRKREWTPTPAWIEARKRSRGKPQAHRGRKMPEAERKVKSEAAKRRWAKVSKAKRRQHMQAALNATGTPQWREKLSEAQAANWEDSDYRKHNTEKFRAAWKRPKYKRTMRKKLSAAQKERWANTDDAAKEKALSGIKRTNAARKREARQRRLAERSAA